MELDHVGIAVRSIAETLRGYERLLGATAAPPELVASQHVRVSFLEVGTTHLEFLEPSGSDSAVARFLERHGEGMHHVAFRVRSVDEKLAELERRGTRVIDRVGRPGARGRRVGFVHPSAANGVLVEFVEVP